MSSGAPKGLGSIAALVPAPTNHTVSGKTMRFFPSTAMMLFQLHAFGQPLIEGIAKLWEDGAKDRGQHEKRILNESGKGGTVEASILAITPELAELRVKMRVEGACRVFDVFSATNAPIIASLVMDSLREEFGQDRAKWPSHEEFMSSIDLSVLIELIIGVLNANKGVFGPLGLQIQQAIESKAKSFAAKLNDAAGSPTGVGQKTSSLPSENPPLSLNLTTPLDGGDSKIESSSAPENSPTSASGA